LIVLCDPVALEETEMHVEKRRMREDEIEKHRRNI
jgi:hypothetical protein